MRIIKQINPNILNTISIGKLCRSKTVLNLNQTEINLMMPHKLRKKTSHSWQTDIKHRSINLTPSIPSIKNQINWIIYLKLKKCIKKSSFMSISHKIDNLFKLLPIIPSMKKTQVDWHPNQSLTQTNPISNWTMWFWMEKEFPFQTKVNGW